METTTFYVTLKLLHKRVKYLIKFPQLRLLWKKKKSCLKRKRFTKKLTEEEVKARNIRKEEFRNKVDDIFLVFFPVMFLIFNLVSYFLQYMDNMYCICLVSI